MTVAYISLGSNLGDRLEYLARAVSLLPDGAPRLIGVSSVYETAPQGKVDQPDFLNVVAAIETDRTPEALLLRLQQIEQGLGRQRSEHWGPRTVDLDLLLFGQRVLARDGLIVPHPRMMERAFVLVPLLELSPNLTIPGTANQRYDELLPALAPQQVRPIIRPAAFMEMVKGVK